MALKLITSLITGAYRLRIFFSTGDLMAIRNAFRKSYPLNFRIKSMSERSIARTPVWPEIVTSSFLTILIRLPAEPLNINICRKVYFLLYGIALRSGIIRSRPNSCVLGRLRRAGLIAYYTKEADLFARNISRAYCHVQDAAKFYRQHPN